MGFDPEQFLQDTGIDVRLGEPTPELPLSSAGKRAQAEMLQHLDGIRATIEILAALIRDYPNADAAFEAVNANFGRRLEDAREGFERFHNLRNCRGAA